MTDGENAYVTPTGFIFAAPRASSLYVPVVTGPYRPPFPVGHMGEIRRHTDNELQRIERKSNAWKKKSCRFTTPNVRTTAPTTISGAAE